MKYLIELLIYVCLFNFVHCNNYNNIEYDMNTFLLDRHKFIIRSIPFKAHPVLVPVSVIMSSVITIINTSLICLFVMWKKQMLYKGTKSPIYCLLFIVNSNKYSIFSLNWYMSYVVCLIKYLIIKFINTGFYSEYAMTVV